MPARRRPGSAAAPGLAGGLRFNKPGGGPGSRRYFREQLNFGGLGSPRPSTSGSPRSSRLSAATGNTRHDVRRSKAKAEIAAIQKRIAAETDRRLKEMYEDDLNCEFDDGMFREWRAETAAHRRAHGQRGLDPDLFGVPFGSPRATPRRSRFEYEGVGSGGAAPTPAEPAANALGRVRGGEAPITLGSVPWPCAFGARVELSDLGVSDDAPFDEKKRAVREAVLCWHPDKWTQQFGDRLDAGGDRDAVMERVTAEARNVHDLWMRLKEESQRVRGALGARGMCGARPPR
ncbi:hypothetical protein JL720_173 [Aureococcus anophagefferens]|nr:hypothetical protein JL720_173 [Aureococcus anophagefferens]